MAAPRERRKMYRGLYKIADHRIEIVSLHETVQRMCADYACEGKAELSVIIRQEDIEAERARQTGEAAAFSDAYFELLAVYRRMVEALLKDGIVLFHGSCLALDGQGYLFTAPSGTGKSTHAALWRKRFGERVVMVNDDKPLLKITNEGVVAYGTPWNGKHRLGTNTAVPLKAICFLERGAENRIAPVGYFDCYPKLLAQVYRPEQREALEHTLSLLDTLAEQVRFYTLACNMEPTAAEVARRGME